MDARRRDSILRDLRKLVLGICCATGALAGVWSAIWTGPMLERRDDLAGELAEILKPVLTHLGVGLGAGAAAGLLVCLTVLRPR
jgi:hypothetical protein